MPVLIYEDVEVTHSAQGRLLLSVIEESHEEASDLTALVARFFALGAKVSSASKASDNEVDFATLEFTGRWRFKQGGVEIETQAGYAQVLAGVSRAIREGLEQLIAEHESKKGSGQYKK